MVFCIAQFQDNTKQEVEVGIACVNKQLLHVNKQRMKRKQLLSDSYKTTILWCTRADSLNFLPQSICT